MNKIGKSSNEIKNKRNNENKKTAFEECKKNNVSDYKAIVSILICFFLAIGLWIAYMLVMLFF